MYQEEPPVNRQLATTIVSQYLSEYILMKVLRAED